MLLARLSEPWAAAEGRFIADCNDAAASEGVRAGMTRAAARALCPNLSFKERDFSAERETLERVAQWAGRFTPAVSLAPPFGLLLEVAGSLKLFSGLAPIMKQLEHGAVQMGLTMSAACAPSAEGARIMARGGIPAFVLTQQQLAAAISCLPVEALDCGEETLAGLQAIGAGNLGDLLALPRAGLARRFGEELLDSLDRALGMKPDPREFYIPPETFRAAIELPAEAEEAQALLFVFHRMLVQLEGFLAARGGAVQRFEAGLLHREGNTVLEVGLVSPSRDAEHFTMLLRERLFAAALKAPVRAVALDARDILQYVPETPGLFPDPQGPRGDWPRFIERLRARLGQDKVKGLAVRAEHRPGFASQEIEPGSKSEKAHFGPRPLWLFAAPHPLEEINSVPHYQGALTLLSGPERIESGWWDGMDVARDYFLARTPAASLLWIYRERRMLDARHAWYLHGIFG